jgi:microcystin-dependent protein
MEGTIGEIRGFAGNFAPRNWAYCQGQLIAISSNTALFSILGTTYGGDGRTTFALPDLRGRVPISSGTGPGLSSHNLGSRNGVENVTLIATQMPAHTHTATGTLRATATPGNERIPTGMSLAGSGTDTQYSSTPPNVDMVANNVGVTVGTSGSSQSHTNMQPYLTINWIICQFGIFPSRN